MCGVNGAVALGNPKAAPSSVGPAAECMTAVLGHRGPDASGVWSSPSGRVALGHTRLAIVDLSAAGSQPMTSRDGRWTITYNGEVYNTDDLRRKITGARWLGHSDTEVLVEHIARFGVAATLKAVKGMFAFGVWDDERSELWLARDRFGEKPVYYGWHKGVFLFASELKALRAAPGFDPEIDPRSLQEYFRWTYLPAPLTIYEGVRKLPPAHFLHMDSESAKCSVQPYWSAPETMESTPSRSCGADAVECLGEVLDRAVAAQMVADVPLGAFLSGGIDSSSVVASMQRHSSVPIQTFTIGFSESDYDESRYAAEVAEVLGTDHTELILSPDEAMRVIPSLPTIYDEPFADSSQIPTFLVSKLAREHVTVALSGDGGDELFGGYDRYRQIQRLERTRGLLTPKARRALGSALQRLSVQTWDRLGRGLPRILVPAGFQHRTGYRMHKLGRLLASEQASDVYASLMAIDDLTQELVVGTDQADAGFSDGSLTLLEDMPPFERCMLIDTLTYLPGDLLTKVDRASMAVGLEVRVPFLHPEVFNFAWGLSPEHRVRNGQGKWVLRELLRQSLPDRLVNRQKMGFGVPVGEWLRGPLRGWAEELLDPALVREQGLLNPSTVERRWVAHRDGVADLSFQVWSLLMFQAWLTSVRT